MGECSADLLPNRRVGMGLWDMPRHLSREYYFKGIRKCLLMLSDLVRLKENPLQMMSLNDRFCLGPGGQYKTSLIKKTDTFRTVPLYQIPKHLNC